MFGYLRPLVEITNSVIVAVGEALLHRLDHDYDHELRDCANCGESVAFLSSRDWCDGCEEAEDEVREPFTGPNLEVNPPEFVGVQMPDGTVRVEKYGNIEMPDLLDWSLRLETGIAGVSPTASAEPPGRENGPAGTSPPPAGSPTTSANPGVAPRRPEAGSVDAPASGTTSLTWSGWAVPAILEVLAEWHPWEQQDGTWQCSVDFADHDFADLGEWREHVAPLIAERIACDPSKAIAALHNLESAL